MIYGCLIWIRDLPLIKPVSKKQNPTYNRVCLTGCGRFTDESDQVVLDFVKSVVVVHDKHVPLTGLAANNCQLPHVNISHSDHKHTVACRQKKHNKLK